MRFIEGLCDTLARVLGLATLSPWGGQTGDQRPLFGETQSSANDDVFVAETATLVPTTEPAAATGLPDGPVFQPPNASPGFRCDYSAMKGWRHTASAGSRTSWLEKPISADDPTGGIYDILTDYDEFWPTGTLRKYTLNATDFVINADGVERLHSKAFNEQYPGPWIEACWGDTLEITVNNFVKHNGTTIHWHGVRQLNSFEHDGVNAITQCPIATNQSFTYKFRVTQYGTSWYHSHYSLQYADGLAGPMTFHGPSAADYDEAIAPFLFSDWSHNSAFEDFAQELHGPPPQMQSVILNGKGSTRTCRPNKRFMLTRRQGSLIAFLGLATLAKTHPINLSKSFKEEGRKYLLRLINTSTATTFIFSIDKHILQVVSMDFVAIEPYYADSILVGIGQRYHVIVEAKPSNDLIPVEDQNYWIRLVVAEGCGSIQQPNELLGVVRYNPGTTKDPVSRGYQFPTACSDEPYESLVPVVPRTVTAKDKPANDISKKGDNYGVGLEEGNATWVVPHGNFSRWDILDTPMWLDFGDPTINHIEDESFNPEEYAIITENHSEDDWVYLIISASGNTNEDAKRRKKFVAVAHPIHLHGHDFVILSQQTRPYNPEDLSNGTFNYENPPRRDVALLPSDGYIAIGFKTDNPGVWIIHCHIAWHASSGLALQIRERNKDIKLSPHAIAEKDKVCGEWDDWFSDTDNWYNSTEFQEDSGV